MIPKKLRDVLEKQHYRLVGGHSAVQICRWAKKSLREEGVCYKEKFYGISSHRCCQMTTSLWCPNQCVHCWRAIEFTTGDKINGKINEPKEIIEECILSQRKLLTGFKGNEKVNLKKFKEAQEPMQFAISLYGEPTTYSKLGEFILELRKRGKTSFLVTNGLYPEKLKELKRKKQLPTQLYISVNAPDEKLYKGFHRSKKEDAWKKLNESLNILSGLKGKTRTVFRINLVKELNMSKEYIPGYANLIKKSKPQFIEVKGYISVGFARQRLGYERMPWHHEIKEFSKKLSDELKKIGQNYKILDETEVSRVVVMGKDKKELKIKKVEI